MLQQPDDLAVIVARHDEKIKNLEQWEQTQNGTLMRLEMKMDAKLDAMNKWLIGLMGGVIAALIMLVVNLALMK